MIYPSGCLNPLLVGHALFISIQQTMKNFLFLATFVFAAGNLFAHSSLKGRVLEDSTKQPIVGAVAHLVGLNKSSITDASGYFEFKGLEGGSYLLRVSLLGYQTYSDSALIKDNHTLSRTIYLKEDAVKLSEITVTGDKEAGLTALSTIDFKLRPHLTTQDLLRLVPGLFIAQHAGGGKAEQLFLRGFDVDHGTDVAISVDNMPVNMVSHAHGQGYADLHFVIPETVERMNFAKGPYDAKIGNLNTAGSVQFQTRNYLPNNLVKTEFGSYNTYRGVTMLNLLNKNDTTDRRHNAYVAAEYIYSRSFFDSPQDFSKVNLFGKYTGQLDKSTQLSFSLSSFNSKWDASGQIPDRAVNRGLISRYGSIDPSEGGGTARYNANLALTKKLDNDAVIQTNLYYVKYKFSLYSNFTFFKNDTVNGDQINQYEDRNIFGYNGSYSKEVELGGIRLRSTAGISLRDDQVGLIGLTHTRNRAFLSDVKKGSAHETNFGAYLDETFYFSPKLSLNIGLRYDELHFAYRNMIVDSVDDKQTASKGIVNPKFNLRYNPFSKVQVYVNAGSGFHSNDTRIAVISPNTSLARAVSGDIGFNAQLFRRLYLNAAVWGMNLESELVYVGDEGTFEASGRTQRIGLDVSARLQLAQWLFLDGDLNLAKPRFLDAPEGANYIPLAPTVTSIAGINVRSKNGFTASLRYRYIGDRPANEDNTIVANGYFITDIVAGYNHKNKYQIGFLIENLFNEDWKEAQFATESRLKGEPAPVDEIHYTPGTPFSLRGNLTFYF